MKKILALVAVGAIAFGLVGAAASQLGNTSVTAPAQGTITVSGGCAVSGATTVVYNDNFPTSDPTSGTRIVGISRAATTCTTETLKVSGVGSFTGVAAAVNGSAFDVTFDPVTIANFGTTGYDSITITAY